MVVYFCIRIHEPFLGECRLLAIECTEALERTHAKLRFFCGHSRVALDLGRKSVERLLFRIVTYLMEGIEYEIWASRL